MALTEGQVLTLLQVEVNGSQDESLSEVVSLLWQFYESKDTGYGFGLRYTYTKLHLINYLLGQKWHLYDTKAIDIEEKESQVFNNLLKLYEVTLKQIDSVEKVSGATEVFVSKVAKNSPVDFNFVLTNPNLLQYKGWPLVEDS